MLAAPSKTVNGFFFVCFFEKTKNKEKNTRHVDPTTATLQLLTMHQRFILSGPSFRVVFFFYYFFFTPLHPHKDFRGQRTRAMSLGQIIRANFAPIFYSLFNLVSVICVVTVNKSVLQTLGFSFPISLLAVHCLVTFAGLRLAAAMGVFELKPLPRRSLLTMALSYAFYNVASLMNLTVASVSSYQLAKIAVAPMTMLIMYVAFGQGTTTNVKLAVSVMLVGIAAGEEERGRERKRERGVPPFSSPPFFYPHQQHSFQKVGVTMATVTDVDMTPLGMIIGMIAVVGAAQAQILIGWPAFFLSFPFPPTIKPFV